MSLRRRVGLALGPLLFLATLVLPSPDLPETAWRVAGLAAWMATWWVTEALPLGVTGLLPLLVVPLVGAGTEGQAASPYGSPVLVLVPATLVASCGFMMPAGTPPNALAISSGAVEVPTMVRAGLWMNLIWLGLIVGYVFVLDAVVW